MIIVLCFKNYFENLGACVYKGGIAVIYQPSSVQCIFNGKPPILT